MAATPCVLWAAADSTSKSRLISFKPYLNSPSDVKDDKELVKPRTHTQKSSNRMEPILNKTVNDENKNFQPNPLIERNNSYHPHSIEKITQEENNFVAPKHEIYPPPLHNQAFGSPPNLENRFDVMRRMKAMMSEKHFPYNGNTRRRFESVPDYASLYRNGIQTPHEDIRRRHGYDDLDLPSRVKCAQSFPCIDYNGNVHHSDIHSKARMKYSHVGQELSIDKNRTNNLKPEALWINNRYPRLDEKHPYLRSEHPVSPMSKDFLGRNLQLDQGLMNRENDNALDVKHSSAFSLIHPSPIRGNFTNEVGYLSDPTNKYYTKFGFPSQPDLDLNIPHRPYKEPSKRRFEIEEPGRHDNKLHIYDEASKAALKAFDAHVEKMITESRDRKSFPSNPHELEMRREVQASFHREKRYGSSTSSSQPLVQVSTVDSTQTSDTTHSVGGLLGLTMVANEHLGQAIAKEKRRTKNNNCLHLWQFLRTMLDQEKDKPNKCIEWTNRDRGEFRLIKTAVIADLWGQSKNRTCMTYEKMARAMRYYYKMKILEKVPHKRLHFRFGEKILAKVFDANISKPIRLNENLEKSVRRFSTPQAYHHANNLIPRPASEGSIPTLLHPPEGLTVQQTNLMPNQNTGVIRSTEEFSLTLPGNGSPLDPNIGLRSLDSNPSPGSNSGDDTPSEISDSDGELVVDADID